MEYMLVSTENIIFFNPEIPGFELCQSRDSGLRKTSGIPGFGIPGLQSLRLTVVKVRHHAGSLKVGRLHKGKKQCN